MQLEATQHCGANISCCLRKYFGSSCLVCRHWLCDRCSSRRSSHVKIIVGCFFYVSKFFVFFVAIFSYCAQFSAGLESDWIERRTGGTERPLLEPIRHSCWHFVRTASVFLIVLSSRSRNGHASAKFTTGSVVTADGGGPGSREAVCGLARTVPRGAPGGWAALWSGGGRPEKVMAVWRSAVQRAAVWASKPTISRSLFSFTPNKIPRVCFLSWDLLGVFCVVVVEPWTTKHAR